MGCGTSKNKGAFDVARIAHVTGMSNKEVEASFKAFKKEAGKEKIPLKDFTKLVASMNTNSGPSKVDEYAKHLFRALDTDKDDLVSFEEVTLGFHHLSSAGDEKSRLRLVFHIFDVNGNGAVSEADAEAVVKAQLRLQGKSVDEAKSMTKNLFRQCDLNRDGKITCEEFLKSGKSIAEMFELDD